MKFCVYFTLFWVHCDVQLCVTVIIHSKVVRVLMVDIRLCTVANTFFIYINEIYGTQNCYHSKYTQRLIIEKKVYFVERQMTKEWVVVNFPRSSYQKQLNSKKIQSSHLVLFLKKKVIKTEVEVKIQKYAIDQVLGVWL